MAKIAGCGKSQRSMVGVRGCVVIVKMAGNTLGGCCRIIWIFVAILTKPVVMPTCQWKETVVESFAAESKGIHVVALDAVC